MTHALTKEQLGEDRKELLTRIERALSQIAGSIPTPTPESTRARATWGHPPAEDREPRVITLDGKRGMGKTSMILALVDDWHAAREPRSARSSLTPEQQVLGDSIILPSVDFDPHPEGLSAYAAIIANLEELVQQADTPPVTRSRRDIEGAQAVSLHELWQQLLERAIVGWGAESHHQARPVDDWAFDVQEQVRHWRRLPRDWRQLIDTLIQDLEDRRKLRPQGLLIMPIDDIDMRVSGMKQLLLALRQLHHPRVVYLVSLDMEQAAWVLKEELQQEAKANSADGLRGQMEELADNILRKSLPAHLVFPLRGLSFAEVARRPLSATGRVTPAGPFTARETKDSLLSLDELFHEAGLTREILAVKGDTNGLFRLSTYLPDAKAVNLRTYKSLDRPSMVGLPESKEVNFRTAHEVLLSMRDFLQRKDVQDSPPPVRVARLLCELSRQLELVPEELRWSISGEEQPWSVHGRVTLVNRPPGGLVDIPERVHEEHDLLLYAGTEVAADPTLVLVRRIIEVEREKKPGAGFVLVRETLLFPPDLSYTWRRVGVLRHRGRFVRFPWPAGTKSPIRAYVEEGPPRWPLALPARELPPLTQWIDERLPGETPPNEHDYTIDVPLLVKRLRSAVAARITASDAEPELREAQEAAANRDVVQFIGVLAAPESGLPTRKRRALVQASAELMTGEESESDREVLLDWFSSINHAREARLRLAADVAELDPNDDGVRNLLYTQSPMHDPLYLLTEWAENPKDWWWTPQQPPLAYIPWSTNAAGRPIFMHLGIEGSPPGVRHFVTEAIAQALWRPEVTRRFQAVHNHHLPIEKVAQGTSANYLTDLWRTFTSSLDDQSLHAQVSAVETHVHMEDHLVPRFRPRPSSNFLGVVTSFEGEWEVDALAEVKPRYHRDLLTALLLVASWLRAPPAPRQMPALLEYQGRTLDWPPLPSPSHDERLLAIARWTMNTAAAEGGDMLHRMPVWVILHLVVGACLVLQEERYVFTNAQAIVRPPGDANGVSLVVRHLLGVIDMTKDKPSATTIHAWVQRVFRHLPMMLPVEARGWWREAVGGTQSRALAWHSLPHQASVSELRLLCALNERAVPADRQRYFEILGTTDEWAALGPFASLEELVEKGHLTRDRLEQIIAGLETNL